VLAGRIACQCRFVVLRHKICATRDALARLPPLSLTPFRPPPPPRGESLPLFSHLQRARGAKSRGCKSSLGAVKSSGFASARSQIYMYGVFARRDSYSQSDFIFFPAAGAYIRWLRRRRTAAPLRRCLLPAFREKCKTQHSYSARVESSRAAAPATAAKKPRDRENTL
jgi:hypothetical protein